MPTLNVYITISDYYIVYHWNNYWVK